MKRTSKLSTSTASGVAPPTTRSHHQKTTLAAPSAPNQQTVSTVNHPTSRYNFRRTRAGVAETTTKAPSPRFALPTASSQSRQRKASSVPTVIPATTSVPVSTAATHSATEGTHQPSIHPVTRSSLLGTRRPPLTNRSENQPTVKRNNATTAPSKATAAIQRNSIAAPPPQSSLLTPPQRFNRFSRKSKIFVPPLSGNVTNPSTNPQPAAARTTSQEEPAAADPSNKESTQEVSTSIKESTQEVSAVSFLDSKPAPGKSPRKSSPRKLLGICSPWHPKNAASMEDMATPLLNHYQPPSVNVPPSKRSPQSSSAPSIERLGISPPWSQQQPRSFTTTSATPVVSNLSHYRPLLPTPSMPSNTPNTSPGMLNSVFGLFSTTVWEQRSPSKEDETSEEDDSQGDIPTTILLSRQSTLSVSSQLSDDSLSEHSASFDASVSTSEWHSLDTGSSRTSNSSQSQTSSAHMHHQSLLEPSFHTSQSGNTNEDQEDDDDDDDEEEDHQASRELLQIPSGLTIPTKLDPQADISGLDSTFEHHCSMTDDGERHPTPIPPSVVVDDDDDDDSSDQLSFTRPPLSQRAKSLLVGCLESDTDDGTAREGEETTTTMWRALGSDNECEYHDSMTGIFQDESTGHFHDEPSFPLDLSSVDSSSPVKASTNNLETPAIDEAMQLFRHEPKYPWLALTDEEQGDLPPKPRKKRIDADDLLLPIPSLRQELEAMQSALPQKSKTKAPMAPMTEELSVLEDSRDDEAGEAYGNDEEITPKAQGFFSWISLMNTPPVVATREQRRGLTDSGLLLSIPSLREELQEAKVRSGQLTSPPMEEIQECANAKDLAADKDSHECQAEAREAAEDDVSASPASPSSSGSSPYSQPKSEWDINTAAIVRVNDRTLLLPIAEEGLLHLRSSDDVIQELQRQVGSLLKDKKELEDKLQKSKEVSRSRFGDVFDEVRDLRAKNLILEAALKDVAEQVKRAFMAHQLEQELQLGVAVEE